MQTFFKLTLIALLTFNNAIFAHANQQTSDNQITLQLKWTHQFQFAGYYMAKAKGFYEQAGLNIEIKPATDKIDPIKEVLEGRADYGVGTSELLIHHESGVPVVVLGVIFQHSPLALLSLEENRYDYITDLAGKRLMIEKNSSEIYALLKQSNIEKNNFKAIPHSFKTQDLINGNVDAMTVYTTTEVYEFEQQKIPYRLFSPRIAGIDFYGDNFFTTAKLIDENPEQVEAFRKATVQGWKYAMNHPQEAIDYIVEQYQFKDPDFLAFEARKMQELMRTDLIEPGYMSAKRWQHIASVYQELGLLDTELHLDEFMYKPDNVIDNLQAKIQDLLLLGLGLLLLGLIIIWYFQRYYSMKGQLDTITAKAPLSILLINEKQEIVQWNQQAQLTFGWSEQEVLGRNIYDFLVFKSHQTRVQEGLKSVFSEQKAVHIENKNLHKDGHELACNWSNAPYDINGKAHIICMALDISELRDYKAATLYTQEHISETVDEQQDFLNSLVEIMKLSLQIWEESTSRSKTAFADESGLWRISIDGGTAKTRTLDKYLSLETIPQKPRWKNVINTANYILRTFPNHRLCTQLQELKCSIK